MCRQNSGHGRLPLLIPKSKGRVIRSNSVDGRNPNFVGIYRGLIRNQACSGGAGFRLCTLSDATGFLLQKLLFYPEKLVQNVIGRIQSRIPNPETNPKFRILNLNPENVIESRKVIKSRIPKLRMTSGSPLALGNWGCSQNSMWV